MTGTVDRPASYGQRRLWLLRHLQGGPENYVVPLVCRLTGQVDAPALRAALGDVIQRHEVLRTTYRLVDDDLVQRVHPDTLLCFAHEHRQPWPSAATEIGQSVLADPFDLATGPVVRARLVSFGPDDHVLALAVHHIACDAWSMRILRDELAEAYRRRRRGERPDWPELPVQYGDVAVWQRRRLRGPRGAELTAHWRDQLVGAPGLHSLPTDRARPATPTSAGGCLDRAVPAGLAAGVSACAAATSTSEYAVLLAGFAALVHRLSGADDLVIGAPVTGRRRAETESLIGFFVNTLPLRLRPTGDITFAELVRAVRGALLDALDHDDMPFDLLVEELAPQRDRGVNPLAQLVFAAKSDGDPVLRLDGVTALPVTVRPKYAKFDLMLTVSTGGDRPHTSAEYAADLFDESTVSQLIQRYHLLLRSAVAKPDTSLLDLPVLLPGERERLVVAGNETGRPYPEHATIEALFRERAGELPDAIAVVSEHGKLTYEALNAWSDVIAAQLAALPVAAEARVGVLVDRSGTLLACLLAVLKAGACYVPLNAADPPARLAGIIQDAGIRTVLTDRPGHTVPDGVRLVMAAPLGSPGPLPPGPFVPPHPDSLACLMYTSGSTGRPKGVMVPHRAVVRLVRGQTYARLGPGRTVLAVSPPGFDAAHFDYWGPLLNGGTVQLHPAGQVSAESVAAELRAAPPDLLWLTASLFNQLVDVDPACLTGVDQVITGGEVVSPDHVRALRAVVPGITVSNGYGPTETTTFACVHDAPAVLPHGQPLPIGGPIANTRAYVLDEHLRVVPTGVPGELFIGGPGVARGYWNRPASTASRFVPDPFGPPGARLYRSGDLVRWRHDGTLEFIGRLDDQIKLRGFRIEPGEITAALRENPAIRSAAVTVRDYGAGDRRLVAYLVAEETLDIGLVRDTLRRRLPAYLVPGHLVRVDRIPLTANGKLDHRALPEPAGRTGSPRAGEALSPLHQALTAAWAEALRVDHVGLDDRFFDLGGHSLLAVSLAHRIRQELGVSLSAATLFELDTPRQLARHIESAGGYDAAGPAPLPTVEARRADMAKPFPLTDLQHAYWIDRLRVSELGGFSAQAYVEFEAVGLSVPRLCRAWNQLIRRHEMLRTIIERGGTQRTLDTVPWYEIQADDLAGLDPDSRHAALESAAERMARSRFAHDSWPLFQLTVSTLPGGTSRVHLAFDAIIADGRSWQTLCREWEQLYADENTELPEIGFGFRDYVLSAEALKSSARYATDRDYWLDRVPAFPDGPDLPVDRLPAKPDGPTHSRRTTTLEADAWPRLKQRCHRNGVSASMLLLTCYADVLAAWSRRPELSVAVTLAARLPLHEDVPKLVGPFTSLLLMARATDDSLLDRARKTQQQVLTGLGHTLFSGVEVAREITRRRGRTGSLVTPVVFTSSLGSAEDPDLPTPEFPGRMIGGRSRTPQVWIDLQVVERDGRLLVHWDVVDGLFPPGLIADMMRAYRDRLELLMSDAGSWGQAMPLPLPEYQRQLLADFNDSGPARPGPPLAELFLGRVADTPDAPAIITDSATLTYGQLAGRALPIARAIRDAGARPGSLVGVVLDKGIDQIAGVLGVLLAGAAYLPIDAALPRDRRLQLLNQAGVVLVVTAGESARRWDWPAGVSTIAVDAATRGTLDGGITVPQVRPDDVAYVIFTSGSTGVPKGVVIEHGAVVNTLLDLVDRFDIRQDDRVLGLSALSFDLSVFDIFGMVVAGGALVLPDRNAERDPAAWARLVREHGVTVWNSVPALFELFVEHLERTGEPLGGSLRLAMLSGDWIPVSLRARAAGLGPGLRMASLGGATEASIWSVYHWMDRDPSGWSSVPYGRPLGGQRLHVLGHDGWPCPLWVPGQLHIGGHGLARGYWRDEARTDEAFFVHPRTGERLYRTGDVARMRPEGEMEFLGRDDLQVKVHGYRIELGEIEAVLAQHPAVEAAAVGVVGEASARRRLVGYVVSRGAVSGEALRDHLAGKLPEYMVPTQIVLLDRLPLSANGKVDRAALRSATPAAETDLTPPTGATEEAVARVWRSLLGVDAVDVDTSFFDAGGNSRLLMTMRTTLAAELGTEIHIADLFRYPTVRTLGALLEHRAPGACIAEPGDASAELAALADRVEAARRRRRPDGGAR